MCRQAEGMQADLLNTLVSTIRGMSEPARAVVAALAAKHTWVSEGGARPDEKASCGAL